MMFPEFMTARGRDQVALVRRDAIAVIAPRVDGGWIALELFSAEGALIHCVYATEAPAPPAMDGLDHDKSAEVWAKYKRECNDIALETARHWLDGHYE